MAIPEEVDIIICGGGSSGCVPAGRLANLDHNLSVLLIEAGEDNLNNQWYENPSMNHFPATCANFSLGSTVLVFTQTT